MLWRRKKIEDFDLEIWGDRARVLDPGRGGEAHAEVSLPISEEDLTDTRWAGRVCRDLRTSAAKPCDLPETIGRELFKAVFGDKIRVAWLQRLADAKQAGRNLRLRLHLLAPELWDLPWELLYDPGDFFLATQTSTPVVRYVELADPVRPLRARLPIRVLAVAAHPREAGPLAIADEIEALKRSLKDLEDGGLLEIDLLEGATRSRLRRKLDEKVFHILHFIGHGTFDADRRAGALLLEGEAGESDAMSAQELSVLLGDHRELRLVVLNVCQGARRNVSDPFSGLAQGLIQRGLPAVVAMQCAISDEAAIVFSQTFYESLARREPIDRAITLARRAMFTDGFATEWAVPVLATRSARCQIFDLTWWEEVLELMRGLLNRWKYLIPILFVLGGLGAWFQLFGRRWIDPNPYWALSNPSECPGPPGLSIAFVKVEPPGRAPFCMGRTEITQHQWRKILGKPPTRRQGGGLPVVRVSWNDTRAFLAELNRRDPAGRYRLPTGEEWGYAAKGGVENPPPASSRTANCANKEEPDGFEDTAPVASYPPNPLGFYDMLGNASEWVSDGPAPGKKTRRGGGFNNALRNCSADSESVLDSGKRPGDAGFRIVREPVR